MEITVMCLFFIFFFSSRRRHTRYIGDWSSDVCSSDLPRRSGDEPSRAETAAEETPGAAAPGEASAAEAGRLAEGGQIGRASCRERREIWVGGGGVNTKRAKNGEARVSRGDDTQIEVCT